MDGPTLILWVLILVTPGNMPDIPVSLPMLTVEECRDAAQAYPEAPFPLLCQPARVFWADLT